MTYIELLESPKIVHGYLQYSPGTQGIWYLCRASGIAISMATGKRYSYKSVTRTGGAV